MIENVVLDEINKELNWKGNILIIEEKRYQKNKRKLGKKDDYFSKEELRKLS